MLLRYSNGVKRTLLRGLRVPALIFDRFRAIKTQRRYLQNSVTKQHTRNDTCGVYYIFM